MGTKNEIPEPGCQEQFQAAVRVIQNLPKNSDGEGMGTCIGRSRWLGSASQEVLIPPVFVDESLPGSLGGSPLPPAPGRTLTISALS